MKTRLRYLLPLLGLAVALPAARAADEPKPAAPEQKKEIRVITGPDHRTIIKHLAGTGEKENVTFLGVETSPVSPTLTAQLGLAEGSGLVVNRVMPDSPAAGALKEHDILLKLDDQILVEQRQLAVLVRGHKEGDEVTLTYLRGGKQATAKVKLAKHEVPKVSLLPGQLGNGINIFGAGPNGLGFGGGNFDMPVAGPGDPNAQEQIDHLLGMMNGMQLPGIRRMNIETQNGGPGDRTVSVTVNTGNSHVVLDDDKGSLDLTIKDGKKELVAKNAKGDQVFSGPINTPEERKALPGEVRGRLEKLEDSTQFSYKTDGDFKGAETRVVRPRGQGIALPPQPAVPARRPELFF
jgi:serine protease Do